MTTTELKETPLASVHRKFGARMVDFAGWSMPVQYKSIIAEHQAVRTKVGLFDVSHMGEFVVRGSGAHSFVQYLIANDLDKLSRPNMALYTQLVMPNGGTVDDLIVYRLVDRYLLVVNASNIEKDWHWINRYISKFSDVQAQDVSEHTALLALQGPLAVTLLSQVVGEWVMEVPSFSFASFTIDGTKLEFGRTGYTGEDGFEIFVHIDKAEWLWNLLMEHGQAFGIEACGLGARDTLRLEAGLPLYGHELDDDTSPLEAGLGWSVKLDKGDFLGRDALIQQKENGLTKQCICLRAEGRALPRQGYPIYFGDTEIGKVSSGSQGIFVGYPIAMGFVAPSHSAIGTNLSIEIRGSKVNAKTVRRPFYKRQI